jgi:hypothetical protein
MFRPASLHKDVFGKHRRYCWNCAEASALLVAAEVDPGSRTVIEYSLSPVQNVTHDAGREMWGVCADSSIEQNT